MTLGGKILALRKARGLSQEQLSVEIGVSRQAISKWELGEAVPDVENIIQLSKLFGVTTDYLLLAASEAPVTGTPVSVPQGTKKHQPNSVWLAFGGVLTLLGLGGVVTFWVIHLLNPVWISVGDTVARGEFSLFLDFYSAGGLFAFCWLVTAAGLGMIGFPYLMKYLHRRGDRK
ncbi:MAG: helix-turn-helix domain-containing protein [Oscillospiraceae bacterium]|nr:helix-turn-helix domain-containing protein [Oscillospiraceae bacterium]